MANNFMINQADRVSATKLRSEDTAVFNREVAKRMVVDRKQDLGVLVSETPVFVATASDVQNQLLVASTIENNLTVAERLSTTPAHNARQYARAGLQNLIVRLMGLNIKGQPYAGVNLRNITISGYSKVPLDPNKQPPDPPVAVTLGDVIDAGGPDNVKLFKFDDGNAIVPTQSAQGQPAQDQHFPA